MTMRLAVFISGSGTNLQAILDAITAQTLAAEVVVVVSNRKAAYGLVRAEQAGVPTLYAPLKPYTDAGKSRADYELEIVEKLRPYAPDLIVLAGWMHVLSPEFLSLFPNGVINLHPALPGAFAGTAAIERTYEAYQRGEVDHGGCMVHYVVPEVDAGPVIAQRIVPITADDTLETFEANLHAAEHQLLVEALQLVVVRQSA